MKVIDLLNKIAKDEEIPKKIKFKNKNYNKEFYFDGDIYKYKDDFTEYAMTDDLSIEMTLNDEVEVIEDNKKIEKISWKEKESLAGFIRNDNDKLDILARRTEKLKKSLNEIIEVLNDKN